MQSFVYGAYHICGSGSYVKQLTKVLLGLKYGLIEFWKNRNANVQHTPNTRRRHSKYPRTYWYLCWYLVWGNDFSTASTSWSARLFSILSFFNLYSLTFELLPQKWLYYFKVMLFFEPLCKIKILVSSAKFSPASYM